MKIVVCIKQVPDTAEVKLDPKTNTLIREGVPSIINHDDKAGLEAALRLREQCGGTVCALCMGPPQAEGALREALAAGRSRAVLRRWTARNIGLWLSRIFRWCSILAIILIMATRLLPLRQPGRVCAKPAMILLKRMWRKAI